MGEGLGREEIPQGLAVGVQTVEKNQIKGRSFPKEAWKYWSLVIGWYSLI